MADRNFIRHDPCPSCGSSNNLAVYDDGYAKCFSSGCEHYTYDYFEDGGSKTGYKNRMTQDRETSFLGGKYCNLTNRGLTVETCKKFGVRVVPEYTGKLTQGEQQKIVVFDYRDESGNLVAQKLRSKAKQFSLIGETKKTPLFGMHLWTSSRRRLVITEGEFDAMALSQVSNHQWPVVSIHNGADGAERSVLNNIKWVDSFDEVILMFDSDEAGKHGVERVAQLLDPQKVKIASLPVKDANQMLLDGRIDELRFASLNSKPYRPDSVISFKQASQLAKVKATRGHKFPWASMDETLLGIRPREIIVIGAGTGVGKTEMVAEMAASLIKDSVKVGLFSFETPSGTLALHIASKFDSVPYHKPGIVYDEAILDETLQRIEDLESVQIYDHHGVSDWDKVQQAIRYMNKVCGTEVFFIDNLTQLATNQDQGKDERLMLESIMGDAAKLIQNLNITIVFVSHLVAPEKGLTHEDGGRVLPRHFKGSRAIQQWAFLMLGLERASLSEEEDERNIVTVRVCKDRTMGTTGETFHLEFNKDTGRLLEFNSSTEEESLFTQFPEGSENNEEADI